MIKIILGGVGSGKSLTAIRDIYIMGKIEPKKKIFTNFYTSNMLKNVRRIKKENIFKKLKDGNNNKKEKLVLNWKFWNNSLKTYGGFDIYLDEVHNIFSSRRSMSNQNVLFSSWIAQVRKITGSSNNDLILISQELERVDVAARDLVHEIIYCEKFMTGRVRNTHVRKNNKMVMIKVPETYIIKYYFKGRGCRSRYITFRDIGKKCYDYRTAFLGNSYFKMYDTLELLSFEFKEDEYL